MTFGGNHCYCFITIYYDLGVITICLLRHTNTSTWSNRAYSFSGSFTITWVGCLYAWLVFNWCLSQIGSLFIYFYWIMTSRNIKGTPHTHHQDKLLKGMEKGVMVMDMFLNLSPQITQAEHLNEALRVEVLIETTISMQFIHGKFYCSFMKNNKTIYGKWHLWQNAWNIKDNKMLKKTKTSFCFMEFIKTFVWSRWNF